MLKIKSNIRIETCLCIHARAYFILCCVVLFKFRFEFNFLFGKALENKKNKRTYLSVFGPKPLGPSTLAQLLAWTLRAPFSPLCLESLKSRPAWKWLPLSPTSSQVEPVSARETTPSNREFHEIFVTPCSYKAHKPLCTMQELPWNRPRRRAPPPSWSLLAWANPLDESRVSSSILWWFSFTFRRSEMPYRWASV